MKNGLRYTNNVDNAWFNITIMHNRLSDENIYEMVLVKISLFGVTLIKVSNLLEEPKDKYDVRQFGIVREKSLELILFGYKLSIDYTR